MNELIEKFAEQCTTSCIDGRGVELNEIDVEKFAELIVRECARAVDRVYETAPPDYGCLDWSTLADGSDVLKHFGVEP